MIPTLLSFTYALVALLMLPIPAIAQDDLRVDIEQISLFECFPAELRVTHPELTCEPSAVQYLNQRLLVINDKPVHLTNPTISPVMWLDVSALSQPHIQHTAITYEHQSTLLNSHQIEAITYSQATNRVIATTDFNWAPDNINPVINHYNRMMHWPAQQLTQAKLIDANSTDDTMPAYSASIRHSITQALASPEHPQGPPYFKIEGLAALDKQQLLLAIRAIGQDYRQPEFGFWLLKTHYAVDTQGELHLTSPMQLLKNVVFPTHKIPENIDVKQLGLSSIERQGDDIWLMSTQEVAEGEIGHQTLLWRLNLQLSGQEKLVYNQQGQPLVLPCKAEGLTFLTSQRALAVCDDDRSATQWTDATGQVHTRQLHQAILIQLNISPSQPSQPYN